MSSINTISSICQVCPSMSKYVKYVKYVINVRWIMMKISHRSMNKKVEVKRLHSKNTYNSLLIFLFENGYQVNPYNIEIEIQYTTHD